MGKAEQVDPSGRDVLAQVGRAHREALGLQLLKQLGVDQMHLAQVGLGRVPSHARAVLNRDALVGVALHAQPRQKVGLLGQALREPVPGVPRHGYDGSSGHPVLHKFLDREMRAAPSGMSQVSGMRSICRGLSS